MPKNLLVNIDFSYLHSVTGGDKKFEKIVLERAVTDIQNQVKGFQEAWQQRNSTAIHNAAHSLKSVTAIAGLRQLEASFEIIERLFADGIFNPAAAITYNEIISEWEAAKPQLEELIAAYQVN